MIKVTYIVFALGFSISNFTGILRVHSIDPILEKDNFLDYSRKLRILQS